MFKDSSQKRCINISNDDVTEHSLVAFLKCFLVGHMMITYEEQKSI
jgi:hypothetical protein